METSFPIRAAAFKKLAQDEERLGKVHQDIRDLKARLKSLRMTREQFRVGTTFGDFVTQLDKLIEDTSTILKEAQWHVASTFTPLEELWHAAEYEDGDEEFKLEERQKISPEEPFLRARDLSLVLVLHALQMAETMGKTADDRVRFAGEIRGTFIEPQFVDEVSRADMVSEQRKDIKDIFDFADELYDFVTAGEVDEKLIEEGREIPVAAAFNEEQLLAFFKVYLAALSGELEGDTSDVFIEALPKTPLIRDRDGQTIYADQTDKKKRTMVDRALQEASTEVANEMRPVIKEEGKTLLERGKRFLFGEVPPQTPSEVQEEEDERVEPMDGEEGAIEGVENIVASGEGERFNKLYTYATQDDAFDESKLPVFVRYRAQSFAVNMLTSVETVDAFISSQSIRIPEFFLLLNNIAIGFLAQKQPEQIEMGAGRKKETVMRYEIDIDTRQPKKVQGKGFRGMTDLDSEIVTDMYLTYVVSLRSMLQWYLNRLSLTEAVVTDDEKKLVDQFLNKMFRFPYPPFDIDGISSADMTELQQRVLDADLDFEPSNEDLPSIDTAVHTNLSAPVRFRMYRDGRKIEAADPVNIVHLMYLIQSRAEHVFNPTEKVRELVQNSLELPLNPQTLGLNWFTNLLISIAKKLLPGATMKATSFRANKHFHTLHLFAAQTVLGEEDTTAKHDLYNPASLKAAARDTLDAYKKDLEKEGLQLLPSRCPAHTHMSKKEKKMKKKDDHDWGKLECELSKAITDQDQHAIIAALESAKKHLEREKEKGATSEHLQKHVQMLQKKIEVATQMGLCGEQLMPTIVEVINAMPSTCPSHHRR